MRDAAPATDPIEELALAARLGLLVEQVIPSQMGRGGLVLQAVNRTTGERLALKVSPAPDPTDPLAKAGQRRAALIREGEVLRAIGGAIGERYVADGDLGPKRWLLTRWVEGERLGHYRRRVLDGATGAERRRLLVDLALPFLATVDTVHAHGLVHGDLQPDHAVRDAQGAIHLLDFELSHRPGDPAVLYRGGLVHFDPPEVALTLLAGRQRAPFDEVAEVYAAAAVLFFAATGRPPGAYAADASFEERLETIAAGRTWVFRQTGAEPFPELERILARGLALERDARYPSVAAMLAEVVALAP
jgi:serine/threonine protein kinase